jgi:hypothetical protein
MSVAPNRQFGTEAEQQQQQHGALPPAVAGGEGRLVCLFVCAFFDLCLCGTSAVALTCAEHVEFTKLSKSQQSSAACCLGYSPCFCSIPLLPALHCHLRTFQEVRVKPRAVPHVRCYCCWLHILIWHIGGGFKQGPEQSS